MAYDHWQHCSTVALCNVGIEGGRTAYCRVVGSTEGVCLESKQGGPPTVGSWGSTEGVCLESKEEGPPTVGLWGSTDGVCLECTLRLWLCGQYLN